jgi:hypothetical protein
LLGAAYIASNVYKAAKVLYKYIAVNCTKAYDLKKRYGENTWVVVTGSTDGIGKAFALYFAK